MYIVLSSIAYEGYDVVGVFSNRQAAEDECKEFNAKQSSWSIEEYIIQEHEVDDA